MYFEFRRLTNRDIPMLFEWLHRPHVREWWDAEESLEEVRANYLESDARAYLARLDAETVAYIQSYPTDDPGVVGIDQFLADPNHLSRGFGTALVTQFVEFLFADPSIAAVIVDPVPHNARAIRCYEKAGFRFDSLKDGAYLMRRERTDIR